MSGDVFKKAQAGQPFRMPAATFNAFVDAAVAHQQGQDVASRYEAEFRQASIISVKNETGSDQPRFACLGIDTPVILPSDDEAEFSNRVAIRGTTPTADDHSDGRFVILLEPLANNAIGLACAAGVCPAIILVEDTEAEAHRFADIKDGTTQLATKTVGPATILWKETVTGGPGVEAWAVIRLGGGSTLGFNKAEMIDDLEQGQSGSAQAWLLEWDDQQSDWTRTTEQIDVYGDEGFRGVLYAGDITDIYYSTEAERWYAVTGGWYFHGKIVNNDIDEGALGEVKLYAGAGEDTREITVPCYSPYGEVKIDDLVAANWNTFSLHWDVMKVEGAVSPGCGLELVDDEQDPADGQLRVKPGDLAGNGLIAGSTGCELEVLPGCGIFVGPGVNVESSQLAGKGLTPGSGICDLDVETGCGLHFFGNALEVDPNDIVGLGLLVGASGCHIDVDISCGLEFDGNSIKVSPQDIAGAGLAGDLFQPGECAVQVDFPVNCGLAFSVGDQLVVDMTQMTGPGIKTWTNPSGCVGVQLDHGCGLKMIGNAVEVDTATLAGQGLNDLGGCQMSVLLGCNMQYGASGEIEPDVAALAGDGLMVQAGVCEKLAVDCNWIESNCLTGFTGAKQVVTAIDCDPYDPYACPVATIETWNFENGLLKSVA